MPENKLEPTRKTLIVYGVIALAIGLMLPLLTGFHFSYCILITFSVFGGLWKLDACLRRTGLIHEIGTERILNTSRDAQ